jgi:hypothetical protein
VSSTGLRKPSCWYRGGGFSTTPRNVAIYLARRLRRDRLKEIGESLQINTYSSISSAAERLKAALPADKGLRRRVERISRIVANSQKQTRRQFSHSEKSSLLPLMLKGKDRNRGCR